MTTRWPGRGNGSVPGRWPVQWRSGVLSVLDELRLRRWRRGQRQVSRFPDDPPDLFLEDEFGIDRDR